MQEIEFLELKNKYKMKKEVLKKTSFLEIKLTNEPERTNEFIFYKGKGLYIGNYFMYVLLFFTQ